MAGWGKAVGSGRDASHRRVEVGNPNSNGGLVFLLAGMVPQLDETCNLLCDIGLLGGETNISNRSCA
jgi:hypothetical protein